MTERHTHLANTDLSQANLRVADALRAQNQRDELPPTTGQEISGTRHRPTS